MKKISRLSYIMMCFLGLFFFATPVIADNHCVETEIWPKDGPVLGNNTIQNSTTQFFFYFYLDNSADLNGQFVVQADRGTSNYSNNNYVSSPPISPLKDATKGYYMVAGGIVNANSSRQFEINTHTLTLFRLSDNPKFDPANANVDPDNRLTTPYCNTLNYKVVAAPTPTPVYDINCTLSPLQNAYDVTQPIQVNVNVNNVPPDPTISMNSPSNSILTYGGRLYISRPGSSKVDEQDDHIKPPNFIKVYNIGTIPNPGTITLNYVIEDALYYLQGGQLQFIGRIRGMCGPLYINVGPKGNPSPVSTPTLTPIQTPTPTLYFGQPTYAIVPTQGGANLSSLCNQLGPANSKVVLDCKGCINPPNPIQFIGQPPEPPGKNGIWTAIGCLPTNPTALINGYVLAPAGLGIAGGIAFLYFLYGAFLILTSAGNAEQVNHGKEIMTSAIAGLLLILFSIFILRVAAHDILGIPGFS